MLTYLNVELFYILSIEYYHYNDFLDAVEAYELDLEDNRIKAASDIVKKVCIKISKSILKHVYNFLDSMVFLNL